MKRSPWILFLATLAVAIASGATISSGAEQPALVAQPPLLTPRAPGRFDYMEVDNRYRRLLVAHTGSRTLDVIDLNNNSVLRQVNVGEGHGIAVDVKDGKYFVGISRETGVIDVGRKYMIKDALIPIAGAIDAIALDTKNDTLYADRFDNGQVVVIDAKRNSVRGAIAIGGDLEYVVYDPISDRIYQNVNSNSTVAVIDPNTNAIVARWPAAPAVELTGLAVDGASHRIFTAGSNGKLAVIDTTTGSVVGSVDITPNVDQIAFDPGKRRIYCASGAGLLSVVQETDAGAELVSNITIPRRAHTVAVDPTTHAVWISYGADDNDYVMKLVPPQ